MKNDLIASNYEVEIAKAFNDGANYASKMFCANIEKIIDEWANLEDFQKVEFKEVELCQ